MKTENILEFNHRFEKAMKFEAEGKVLHAIQILHQLINDYPLELSVPIALSTIYEKQGNILSSKRVLLEALNRNPDNKTLRLYTGHFLFKNQYWNETIDILSRLLPEEEPIAMFFTGYAYYMLQDYKIARGFFRLYLKSNKNPEFLQDAYLYLCRIAIQLNDFEDALNFVKKAAQFSSTNFEISLLFAIVYFNLDMVSHAMDSIESALKLKPDDRLALEWAGKIYLAGQEYRKAENCLRTLINESDEIDAEVYSILGSACLNNKNFNDAVHFFELALKINPELESAKKGLTQVAAENIY